MKVYNKEVMSNLMGTAKYYVVIGVLDMIQILAQMKTIQIITNVQIDAYSNAFRNSCVSNRQKNIINRKRIDAKKGDR